jgi:hypothetical protein
MMVGGDTYDCEVGYGGSPEAGSYRLTWMVYSENLKCFRSYPVLESIRQGIPRSHRQTKTTAKKSEITNRFIAASTNRS